jgi:hypothetical protein
VKRNYKRLSPAVKRNLLSAYDAASPSERQAGLSWYQTAHDYAVDLARRYGITVEQSAAVIAALSPGLAWELNLVQAETLLVAWRAGNSGRELPLLGAYGREAVDKCSRILAGDVEPLEAFSESTAPKTRAFYRCILDPLTPDVVVVDRHAARAALSRRGELGGSAVDVVSPALYRWIARHYVALAKQVDLLPNQVQAIVWCHWRVDRRRLQH